MKKIVLILAAIAGFACAQAQMQSGILEVGDYYGSTIMVEGSYFDVAPTSFYLAHTGSQMIYTADDLAPLAEHQNVKINKLIYRYFNMDAYTNMTRRVRVYVQPLEAVEFAKIEGVKQFFDFDEQSPIFDETFEYELVDTYGDDGELELDISDLPFEYQPGKGMLVTVVMDAIDDDNCLNSGFDLQFYSTNIRSRAMTYTDNWKSFLYYKENEEFPDASAIYGCGTNVDLPVTKIEYIYDDATTKGDINGDGKVDVDDINVIINIILGTDATHDGDLDGDRKTDVQDINTLLNIILGL